MILNTDIPTRAQVDRLIAARSPGSVSIYLATDPASTGAAERIELKNLASEAVDQLRRADAGRDQIAALDEELTDLVDDEAFLRHQAHCAAVFATPHSLTTFRLPHRLTSLVEVSDRFHVKPLLRAVTFPQLAFVLALAQGSVRLIEVAPDIRPAEVEIADLPLDVASAAGRSSISDRAPSRRVQGSEGQKLRMRHYARQVDQALRPFLNGVEVPLILAASEPIATIFRSVNSSPGWRRGRSPATGRRSPTPSSRSEHARARPALRRAAPRSARALCAAGVRAARRVRRRRGGARRHLRIRRHRPGRHRRRCPRVDHGVGAVSFGDASADRYGVVDEIARRVWLSGGRVLAVRRDDIPGREPVAAILRYPSA